jgi:hypothetical protein
MSKKENIQENINPPRQEVPPAPAKERGRRGRAPRERKREESSNLQPPPLYFYSINSSTSSTASSSSHVAALQVAQHPE